MTSGHQIVSEVHIDRVPRQVYDYVTKPSRWHEWHPASKSAIESTTNLQTGDRFLETASMKPIPFLPVILRRQIDYVVVQSSAPHLWEVSGESNALELRIRYELHEDNGTHFRRQLQYTVKGGLSIIEPFLIRPKMERQSQQALLNLKRVLER